MKKIMFNGKYGLTQAVLEGRKTMTRRIMTCPKEFKGEWVAGFYVYKRQSDNAIIQWPCMYDADECAFDGGEILPRYKVGEVVAVAQKYSDIGIEPFPFCEAGWANKMFVRADLMPHHIRITDVKVERLQDISDEDCIKEGIYPYYYGDEKEKKECGFYPDGFSFYGIDYHYPTPREAYAVLIDLICGKGTWQSNPWVFAYEFELVD